MLVNDILSLARNLTATTSSQFPNSTLIGWANIVYKNLINKIVGEVSENYFVTTQEIDAVADQDGYTFSTNQMVLKEVKIKPKGYNDFIKSTEIDFSKQEFDLNYYLSYQPLNNPRHQIIGDKIYIAPRFISATTNSVGNKQINLLGEMQQTALAVDGAESTVKLPVDQHHVIAYGIVPMIYSANQKINEKNDAIVEFGNQTYDMLSSMKGRDETANYISLPNDYQLE